MKNIRVAPNLAIGDLPSIVAATEGFFEAENLLVTVLDKNHADNSQSGVFDRQKERLFEEQDANLYNACVWGSIHRALHSKRQMMLVQRRSCVFPAAIVIRNDSTICVPEDLKAVPVAVSDFTGSYYMTFRMLGGFLERDDIRPLHVGHPNHRLEVLSKGEVEAAVLIEPYISLAEKNGHRVLIESTFWGLELCDGSMSESDAEGYRKAICRAVDLINKDRTRYLQIVIDREGLADRLEVPDLKLSRFRYVYPERLSERFLDAAVEWMHEGKHLDSEVASATFRQRSIGFHSAIEG
jgi:NitT/TauT family transport system substrate-binding protein